MWGKLYSYPKAILHIDADSFFAACEVALNPKLRGKPVVTGQERGIASAMSYEAKARGVTRGMTLSEVRRICPDVVILPSDYETYSLFSERIFNIVRRYTPDVEEYSIDECFADITGLRRTLSMSYEKIAAKVKHDLDSELGITFSVGLATTKVLAKVASNWNKPSGLTFIPSADKDIYLKKLSVNKIWGIGTQTSEFLKRHKIKTAYDFISKDEEWVTRNLSKPYQETWHELRGTSVYSVTTKKKESYKSISKTKTFTPPSHDRNFIFAQLSKNIENACIKARRYNMTSDKIRFFLKTQDFKYKAVEIVLSKSVSVPQEIINVVRPQFDRIFGTRDLYRATGVTLMNLKEGTTIQNDLFGEVTKVKKINDIYKVVDRLDKKYGKHTIFLGSSFRALKGIAPTLSRWKPTRRKLNLFPGETFRRHIGIPHLGEVV
ncbi:DNA polymerase IV [Candidatus Wolfebacteria bacterium]|nr:MAG: DNA polymerase IV [Candidatus Wolfebacteria bacterium]